VEGIIQILPTAVYATAPSAPTHRPLAYSANYSQNQLNCFIYYYPQLPQTGNTNL